MSNRQLIDEKINQAIFTLQERGADAFDPNEIADQVDVLIDPERLAPPLTRHTSILMLREITRRLLAHNIDPIERASRHIEQETGDLFSGVLQDHYPVKRFEGEEARLIYLRRDLMTEQDIYRLVERMDKAGDSLKRHAAALKAYFRSKAA